MPEQSQTGWQPDRAVAAHSWPDPPLGLALARGFAGHCPACGHSGLFRRFLKVEPECPACHAPVGAARADDAPPYFTIVIVGHIVIPLMMMLEKAYSPPLWLHAAIFLPMTLVLALGLLQPVKGATVGLMLKLGLMKTAEDG